MGTRVHRLGRNSDKSERRARCWNRSLRGTPIEGWGVVEQRDEASVRVFTRTASATLALGFVFLLWLVSDLGSPHTEVLVSDLVFVAVPLFAARTCWTAHRRDRHRHTGWWWISVGCLTWAAASMVFAYYQVVQGRVAPIPSLADIGYVGYAIPVAVGVLRFPRAPGNVWSRWRSSLDSLVIAACLLLVSAVLVLDPILNATTLTFTRVTALAYPLADVAVSSIVLARCVVLPDIRRMVWIPLSVGLLVLSVTDSVYVARSFLGEFTPGGPLDVGWFAAFALIGLAGTAPPVERRREDLVVARQTPGFVRQLGPSIAIGLAITACVLQPSVLGRHLFWWLVLTVAICVVVRQLVVVADQVTLARDLSQAVDRRTAELKHREQWWQDIVQNLSDVVMVIDRGGTILYCSPSVGEALGHWPLLKSVQELRTQVHPDDHDHTVETITPVVLGEQRHAFVECRIRRADGSYGWFEVSVVGQLSERALEGAVLTLHDVSERRELTTRLIHQAHHDALTGLPNRALLMERLEGELVRRDRQFGLLLLDLDDFKVINDRHGHASGDVVLTVIGQRLTGLARSGDIVARLGGDEFAYLVRGTGRELRAVADRLVEAIEEPVAVGGRRFNVRTSIGIVLAGDGDAETAQSLLSHADIALYEAKAHDKGGIVLIEGAEREDAAKQVQLKEQIAQPDLSQFFVVYQPIVDLATGQMRGVEALLRWTHPDLGPIPPDVFIPMAEHGGPIQVLGWYVLDQACAQLARWNAESPGHRLAVGVNASVRQLEEPGFAQQLIDLIASHRVAPDQVVLELTEQALAVDFDETAAVVAELRAGSVSVAVDDYGTGYSSLRYLDRFDADVVKIDRSFVANVVDSVHTQKIVRSVMHMAQSLDLQSIAEGIETVEQWETVRSLGCELGQGYLFSRPVPPEEITRMLCEAASSEGTPGEAATLAPA
jgi:diguanylate cyclase (GGDEF)-like protein/PAS domain S-box-containing protein